MARQADGHLATAKDTYRRRLDVGWWVEGKAPGSIGHRASPFLSESITKVITKGPRRVVRRIPGEYAGPN